MGRYASLVNAHAHDGELQRCYCRDVPRLVAEVRRLREAVEAESVRAFLEIADFLDGEAPQWQACAPAVSAVATMVRIRAHGKEAPRGD